MSSFVIRGTRGTIPACNRSVMQTGGNTTCFTITTQQGIIVIDAGSGIVRLNTEIPARTPPPITLLFTHFHMDHIIGLPCFAPLYDPNTRITMMADPDRPGDWKGILKTFMGKPYWPIGLGETAASMSLVDIPLNQGYMNLYGIRITWMDVPHPQECLAFRFEHFDKIIVVATDLEYEPSRIDPVFVDFCRGADILIHDAQYTPEEYPSHRGWGHSTWETATEAARLAHVDKLLLTHHAPDRTDDQLAEIVLQARRHFPNTDLAIDDLHLTL